MKDPKGINTLNNKIINSFNNFNPDLIITGHADNISHDTFEFIKNKNKSMKIAQWFLDPVSKFGPDFDKNKNRLKNIKFIDANFLTTDPNSLILKLKIHISFQILQTNLLKLLKIIKMNVKMICFLQ